MDINRKKRNRLYVIVFIVYMVFLMYFLFFSDLFGRTVVYEDYRYNLEPFKEIRRFCTTVKEKDYIRSDRIYNPDGDRESVFRLNP